MLSVLQGRLASLSCRLLVVVDGKVKRFGKIAIAIIALLTLVGGADGQAIAQQGGGNEAGLVLQFPDGATQTYCIPFEGESISGLEMLLKTGLNVKVEAYGGLGAEVCQIGETGCSYPEQPCACQSYGPGGVYWSYHHLKEGKWKTSIVGAGSYKVHNGDVEGWAWSDGKPPRVYTLAELCPATALQPSETMLTATTVTLAPPTQRPATTTAMRPSPTRRPSLPGPTNVPTRKPLPAATRNRVAPTVQPVRPTQTEPPRATATSGQVITLPTAAKAWTSTPLPTATATAVVASPPTVVIQSSPTAPAPTRTSVSVQSRVREQEDTARNVGIVIAGVVLGSLALWGVARVAGRGRERGGGGTNGVE